MEQRQGEREEKSRSVFENAVVGFYQSTPEGRFIQVNPALARMLKYASPEELTAPVSTASLRPRIRGEFRIPGEM
ncbi:MAG: PAS domain-containing protein [Deltaproteobacteria bacterium]|nr:PAS domain-containing protein [Deltaproteobacteria bacterium]